MAAAIKGRPAHAPGPTYLAYSPNGQTLITAGANGALRIYKHNTDSEPVILDVLTDAHTSIVATNDKVYVGAEDGSVTKYALGDVSMDDILTRCAAPIRDLALSPDGNWLAVASDENDVKIVNTSDMSQVKYLREQNRSAKHISFDPTGLHIAVSCSDGSIYIYSVSSEPRLTKKIDGIIPRLEGDAESSSKVQWHPDGRAISAPTSSNLYAVLSTNEWKQRTAFSGHAGDITAAAWSPNGALLATAGKDHQVIVWEARTQRKLARFQDTEHNILSMEWHPTDNLLMYSNDRGELFTRESAVPSDYTKLLRVALEPAPLAQPLKEISGNSRRFDTHEKHDSVRQSTEGDDIDSLIGPASDNGDGFIEDDDGAGYAEEINRFGKRAAPPLHRNEDKRAAHEAWQPEIHEAFQSGSTPWKGNRRYLCLNLAGFVWTVNQETHHTVTAEFYDRDQHRDFHFTDPYMYDKACLNDKGTLFSSLSKAGQPAMLYYRPHETWTTRTDWRFALPAREDVTSMSLSESCIVATTTAGYVRIFSLFGVPLKVYRQKSMPAVTCASWRDYVFTVGNGAVGAGGITRLCYTIENVKRDETYQSEDTLPLPEGTELKAVFFSDKGDPCMYDTEGVLLILQHWRTPGQARWVPLLETKALARLASGRKDETYWPVAVAKDKFHCIILKGGETSPYFPRPLLSDFDFHLPVAGTTDEDDEQSAQHMLEEQFVRSSLQYSLLTDMIENTNATSAQKAEVPVCEREVDKILLQMMGNECREGEERGMKALELATLMRDRSGKMLEAAVKIAARFQRDVLGEKLTQLAERRLVGLVDDDDL
ncbi:hypothetical protein AMS68_006964 [Peltaster fructicola]|uniref:Uncharacterized protein n=1 Tax=Peltaster fructicola TaxID=286661 RepID=A0A6H0Y367_9PEZI|nr:hypothetical protein AMS68_006964 [Peltaster fructicola]